MKICWVCKYCNCNISCVVIFKIFRMPQHKNVESLMDLCHKRIPSMVKVHIVTLTEHLVDQWWERKLKQEEKRTFKFEHREKVVLASGRVKEMEEVVVGDGDIDFEFKEDLDQYDLTHIELDNIVNDRVKHAVTEYR